MTGGKALFLRYINAALRVAFPSFAINAGTALSRFAITATLGVTFQS